MKLAIVRTPFLGRAILAVYRTHIAVTFARKPFLNFVKWLFRSKEITNFTYDLEETNKRYLASLIADIMNTTVNSVMAYIEEIEQDEDLKRCIIDAKARSNLSFMADTDVHFGRRIGWYAFARLLKPRVVVETGVDKGLGACVLTAALKRNREDGFEGQYFGTDINPEAGYLLSGDYANYGKILYGDSIESLRKLDGPIDLFINDSDHSDSYEAKEYEVIANKLSKYAIVLGDNSHCTDKLLNFSLSVKRHFVFFKEQPVDQWYPGAGIGISFVRRHAPKQAEACNGGIEILATNVKR